jgi:DNA-binding FadR family transcriptional regulator
MSPDTARRPLRSDEVHDDLRRRILGGDLAPGEAIPSERVLAERVGVNRHAVREAIKRLQQAGLVVVSQGGATRVLDWQVSGGLELLIDVAPLLESAQRWRALRSIAEMRASIGADVARLCALEAPAELRDALPGIVEAMVEAADFEGRLLAYELLWLRIVEGSGNLAYRLAFNSLVAARHGDGVSGEIYAAELADPEGIAELADAIAAGDPEEAAASARRTLDRTIAAAQSLLEEFEEV